MWAGRFSGGVLVFSGRIQNIVDCSHVPCHNILLLYRIKHLSLSYDTLQTVLHNILMDNKEVWNMPGTTCACEANLSSHGRYKFTVCLDCSVLPSDRFMTRGLVTGLIFLSGAPGEKIPVVYASSMAWLTSLFILDVLNRVSCFGYSMLSMVELSISASIRAVMSSFHFLWKIILSSSLSSSSYKVM